MRQVKEIRRLDADAGNCQDPCHLAWQVNKIPAGARRTGRRDLIHLPDEPAGVLNEMGNSVLAVESDSPAG